MALQRLTAKQRKVAKRIYQRGRRKGATYQEIVSALETGRVEANFSNPNHGDGTSKGWRQETSGSYGGKNRTNLNQSIDRYFNEVRGKRGKYKTSGELAQSVQRSAFPGRYNQKRGEAKALFKELGGKASGSRSTTKTIPGEDHSADRKQAIAQYLLNQPTSSSTRKDPFGINDGQTENLLQLVSSMQQAKDTPDRKVKVKGKASNPKGAKGTATFEGVRVAAWIKPELVYARRHGWKGKVTSGFRSRADQTRIYNSGVRPAARPGTSNHEGADFPRGAVDVSDAATLSRILRRKRSALKFAGAKDPVHFSHPHGGSY